MKTNLFFKWVWVLTKWFGILAVLVLMGFGFARAVRNASNRANERDQQRAQTIQQMTKDAFIGYAAGEEHLEDGESYWVNISGSDLWLGRTNNLAVVSGVVKVSSNEYRHVPESRLFQISKPLERGYYRVTRVGTNVSFEQIRGFVRQW